MKTLIVDNHSKHTARLAEMFDKITIITKENFGQEKTEGFDLVVFSGGSNIPSVVDHPEYYQEEIDFVRNTEKAVLGICLGCEIICEAFGGAVQFLPEKEFGNKTFQVVDQELGALVGNTTDCYEAHMVGMIKIPDDFEICVASEHGPECIKHKTKPIVGIQYHPEVKESDAFWIWVRSVLGR